MLRFLLVCCFVAFCVGAIPQSSDVWNTTVRHALLQNGSAISVEFEPPEDAATYNFSVYLVELWFVSSNMSALQRHRQNCGGLSGRWIHRHRINTKWPLVQDRFQNTGPSGFYCIRVSPLRVAEGGTCRDGCRAVTSGVFFLKGTSNISSADYCRNWDPSITLDLLHKIGHAVMSYDVSEICILSFRVELWFQVEDICDGTTGSIVDSLISFGWKNTIRFRGLSPGSYCVRLIPHTSTCKDECLPRFGLIKHLYLSAEPLQIFPTEVPSTDWPLPTFLCVSLLAVTTLVFGALYWRMQRKKIRRVRDERMLKEDKLHMQSEDVPKAIAPDEVVLLDFPGSGIEAVPLLVDFLRSCCGLRVCTAPEEIHWIAVSPEIWVSEKLTGGNRKIILVESVESVRRQKMRSDLCTRTPSNDGLMEKVFDYAMDLLVAKRSLDYEAISVVRFGDVPSDCILDTIVPSKRFTLPRHLFELYSHLVDSPRTFAPEESDVLRAWERQPSYVALCDSLLKTEA